LCGLVGVAGQVSVKGEQLFRRMLELDTVRGPHSTGIFAVKSDKTTLMAKAVGTPWDLYDTKKCESIFHALTKVLIGHNRWATKGKINKTNAHPFEFEHIAGAHNGTLTTTYQLDDHKDFEVDSENLYHHMDKNGVDDTIKNLNGAFALTWYDKRTHSVSLIRNADRPLYYAFSEDMKTLMWASEAWMINIACQSVGIVVKSMQMLPVGVLHTFEVPDMNQVFDKVRVRNMELYVAPKTTVTIGGGSRFPKDPEKKVVSITSARDTGSTPVGKIKRPFSEYQRYVGKSCVFSVGSTARSSTGQSFVQCWLVDDEDIAVRVFPALEGDMWNTLVNSTGYFRALAKSYSGVENGYLTVDLRTVEEIDLGDDTPVETCLGFEGEEITEEEFDKRSKKGCSWCSSHVMFPPHEDVTWIAKDDFICQDCAAQPEVKQYLVN
jgi:hypothetical protein